jgi:hypothetical protein
LKVAVVVVRNHDIPFGRNGSLAGATATVNSEDYNNNGNGNGNNMG